MPVLLILGVVDAVAIVGVAPRRDDLRVQRKASDALMNWKRHG